MKKKTIVDTPFGVALNLQNQALEAAKFMVRHPSCVLGDDAFDAIKSSVKMTVSSAFADIYSKVLESGAWKSMFTLLDLSNAEDSVPVIFTLDDITIDGKYVSSNMPKTYQNSWLNLTPIMGKGNPTDAYNGILIKDTPTLARMISRAALSMSYNDSDGWLNASMNEVIIDAYSTLLGLNLKNLFNLDMEEYAFVRTMLAAYYAQLLSPSDDPKEVPPLLFRCHYLGTPKDISERFETIGEERQKLAKAAGKEDVYDLDLDIVCKLIAKFGPQRMSSFTSSMYAKYMSRSAMDRNALLMSLDYPPYFVYLLLANLHGSKNFAFNNLLKLGDMKRKVMKFAADLISSKLFIEKIAR